MFAKGHKIKVSLARNARTQKWLIERLKEVGIDAEKSELSNILSGSRGGPKADRILSESERILKDRI